MFILFKISQKKIDLRLCIKRCEKSKIKYFILKPTIAFIRLKINCATIFLATQASFIDTYTFTFSKLIINFQSMNITTSSGHLKIMKYVVIIGTITVSSFN